ncbi:hypothetical protein [Nocardia sp. BMG111209]|uniref:hypothetical protein n=1 Tax=Nocardia sp. BMG111209 TaxID=1160137 RepID=UPI001E522F1D|nr:hypothetical protein [Nocardia sp. BMG111209]
MPLHTDWVNSPVRWADRMSGAARDRVRRYLRAEHRPVPSHIPLDPGHHPARRVADEVRWSFAAPRYWLEGVAANLVLSLLYLLVSPLAHPHRQFGWVVLVGTYFATFILADVTTTNILGLDAPRVRAGLAAGLPVRSILLTKNLALLIIVGLPLLALTAVLAHSLPPTRLVGTLFTVLLPLLCWLGVGNLISVLLPVETRSLVHRWRARRSRETWLWLGHLALPYALYYLVAPIDGIQHDPLLRLLPHIDRNLRFVLNTGVGLSVWLLGTLGALLIVRYRGLRGY